MAPDLRDAFVELGRLRLTDTNTQELLTQVANLVGQSLPGADQASVTLVRGERAHTAAFSGLTALHLDEVQYEYGHGPCLDAAANAQTVVISDMATDDRWREFAARAAQMGILSSLSVGLPVQQDIVGALNVYGRKVDAFDGDAVTAAETFASYAAITVANVVTHENTRSLAEHMQKAMESRAVIEQAKGILMGQRGCDADEAFAILVRLSQQTNRKLRDVASLLVEKTVQG
jgi:transcriptional regulator with GAF, ATPase, and Fis domain